MVQVVNWVPPENVGVGSVLIYRAEHEDAVYSVVSTIGAKDSVGNWVVSYTDVSGTADHFYRIQFWDGIGSSELSDPISSEKWYLLSTIDEVKRILRITNNSDIGSNDIYDAIVDSDDEIFHKYGDPIQMSYFTLTLGSTRYQFQKSREPAYRVDRVDLEDVKLPTGSFSLNLKDSEIVFDAGFVESFQGQKVEVEWVPKIFNVLSKNLAGLSLVESHQIIDGRSVKSPDSLRLERVVDRCRDLLRPKGVYGSTSFDDYDERGPGEYVDQDFYKSY